MGKVKVILGAICLLVVFLWALVINLVQLSSLVFLPFSRKWSRNLRTSGVNMWWKACVFCLRKIIGIKVVVSGDEIMPSTNAIVVANHQCWSDVCVLSFFALRGGMAGHQKWLVKEILKYVPGIGWGLIFVDAIFLKRNWHSDKAFIQKTFSRFINEKIPFWIMCFAEGTRKTREKHLKNMRYAERMGLKKTEHVMIPRTKGFVTAVTYLRSEAGYIYDVTIAYSKVPKSIISFFCGECPIIYCYCRKIKTENLPFLEDEISKWLRELYVEKDNLLASFYKQGDFVAYFEK